MALVNPHGREKKLKPLLLLGSELEKARGYAKTLKTLSMTSRETSDLIMMGIGAFTPLEGFMGKDDWKGVCDKFTMKDGVFWPIPITLSADKGTADGIKVGDDVALIDAETSEIMGIISVSEKYSIDKAYECQKIFTTTDTEHPGVQKVMAQGDINIAGKVKVLNEGSYPIEFKEIYRRPAEVRKIFEDKGWSTVAAFQTRNPMHRSHEYLAKVAIETTDGVLIHQLIGKLKPGDIPASVRAVAINTLIDKYFVKDTIVQAGYPMEMRYAGPREALLHAVFRQNYGCSRLIVGRDHAGVGDYYGPFDAHKIFDEIPKDALELRPLKMDWTFFCHKCDGMASARTCPHSKEDRLILSGTMLRKLLSEGKEIPDHFSRPEVVSILKDYYGSLSKRDNVDVKLNKASKGEI